MVKITILVENESEREDLKAEGGFSAYVASGDVHILFDTAMHGAFLENARQLSVDLAATTHVIFSHGHNDHTKGLKTWLQQAGFLQEPAGRRRQLILHPDALNEKRDLARAENDLTISSLHDIDLPQYFDVHPVDKPYPVTPDICFLGTIPRLYPFEGRDRIGDVYKAGAWQPDQMPEDSALAIRTDKGLVILTGCSHSGICNIVQYARQVMGEHRIADIIGGLHLGKSSPADIEAAARCLRDQGVSAVHACHCTGQGALDIMDRYLPVQAAHTGSIFEF